VLAESVDVSVYSKKPLDNGIPGIRAGLNGRRSV
jgi:hypothetical protein